MYRHWYVLIIEYLSLVNAVFNNAIYYLFVIVVKNSIILSLGRVYVLKTADNNVKMFSNKTFSTATHSNTRTHAHTNRAHGNTTKCLIFLKPFFNSFVFDRYIYVYIIYSRL